MKIHEEEELRQELVERWTEVHKKSMVMFLLLIALAEEPMWAKELEKWLLDVAGWDITERGLHRTLKRMNNLGLIEYEENNAPRTGVKRKNYTLTKLGESVLKDIQQSPLKYLSHNSFITTLKKRG